jgi:translation initiation factor 3 subunit H
MVDFVINLFDLSILLAMQFQYYYRNLSRQQSQQQAWLQKRR